jgi:hypothetical protein
MMTVPLEVLLSFPLSNYTNPQTRGPALVIINAILLFFVTLVVVLRIYTRTIIKRSVGYDDYSMVIGYVFTVGLVAIVVLANHKYYWCVDDFGTCVCFYAHGFLGNVTYMTSRSIRYPVSCPVFDRFTAWQLIISRPRKVRHGGERIVHYCSDFHTTFSPVVLLSPSKRYWATVLQKGPQCVNSIQCCHLDLIHRVNGSKLQVCAPDFDGLGRTF